MSHPEVVEIPTAPEPEFQVLGASGRRHAAAPALDFDVHVSDGLRSSKRAIRVVPR